ncbi:MAG: SH3 domain-containing protein [Chloroflexi bacterium]|nr:SH3 domain-containing protein [Chloroflexota bacterium]
MASEWAREDDRSRDVGDPAESSGASPPLDAPLEDLRAILVGADRPRIAALENQVAALQRRTDDKDAWIAAITPVLGDVIRRKIRDSREEMIEAFYPIIGQLIGRAVAEAIRELARSIDQRMRVSFSPQAFWRRLRARVGGVSEGEMWLREALPFSVREIFLIHRPTGLLLCHLSRPPDTSPDSDLISGMLTAIRDFVQDAFGRGTEGQLDEIQYGAQRILIETAQNAYLAVVVDGVEPSGFRATMRDRLIEIEHGYTEALRKYDGDATRFAPAAPALRSLMIAAPPAAGLSLAQRRILMVVGAVLVLCLAAACLAGAWLVRDLRRTPLPTPAPVIVVITATPAAVATATATPAPNFTATPTPIPTATVTASPPPTPTAIPTATATATPTAQPKAAVNTDRLNVRAGPGLDFVVFAVVEAGQTYTIVGRNAAGAWLQICCVSANQPGWVSADWVVVQGDVKSLPERLP